MTRTKLLESKDTMLHCAQCDNRDTASKPENVAPGVGTVHLPGLVYYCLTLGACLTHVSENTVHTYSPIPAGQMATLRLQPGCHSPC